MQHHKPDVQAIHSLEQAWHTVDAIINYHIQRKLQFASSDNTHALNELWQLSVQAEQYYQQQLTHPTQTGLEYLQDLEGIWAIRFSTYQSEASYGSDIGCLGSVLSDLGHHLKHHGILTVTSWPHE